MRLDFEALRTFERASFDRNPLHGNPSYAKRTPYGQCLVYGMLSALYSLGVWAQDRKFSLRRFHGSFKRPLFAGMTYPLEIEEGPGQASVSVKVMRGRVTQAFFDWEWDSNPPTRGSILRGEAFSPLPEPRICPQEAEGEESLSYEPDSLAFEALLQTCGLRVDQMPTEQYFSLLWASYYVGMEVPGERALFSSFSFEYEPCPRASHFRLSHLKREFQPEFKQWEITGSGTGIRAFELSAFERPRPVVPLYQIPAAHSMANQEFSRANVLITGAARGFGAVLAQAFATARATVFAHGKERSPATPPLEKIRFVEADLNAIADCRKLASCLVQENISLDYLVINASPPILPIFFLEQEPEEWMDFLRRSVSLFLNPCSQLLPLLREGGKIIVISSSYVSEGRREFTHYTAAKAAVEGAMRSLAHEHPKLTFIIARLPPMLTDQTNIPVPLEPLASPSDVADAMLSQLRHLMPFPNLVEFNLTVDHGLLH